jgi:hypothetical protein
VPADPSHRGSDRLVGLAQELGKRSARIIVSNASGVLPYASTNTLLSRDGDKCPSAAKPSNVHRLAGFSRISAAACRISRFLGSVGRIGARCEGEMRTGETLREVLVDTERYQFVEPWHGASPPGVLAEAEYLHSLGIDAEPSRTTMTFTQS